MTRSLRSLAPVVGLALLLALPAAAQIASGARSSAETVGEAVAEAGGSEALARGAAAALTEDDKLTASDADDGDRFGISVSLSGDRALVGAPFDDCAEGSSCGAAYVFEFDGTTWIETAKLTASDAGINDRFGGSVSLSGDRALVGASGSLFGVSDSRGAAYVFDFGGTRWTETKLTASDADDGDLFGSSVSLSGDRVLVGAPRDDCAAGLYCGSAYVFDFDGTRWTETKLTAFDADAFDSFGFSVSVSDGRALIGATGDECATITLSCGSAYVFDFDGMMWTETAKLTASDADLSDRFGASVSLSGDRALVGAPGSAFKYPEIRGAYVFDFDGTRWTETKLTASDAAAGDFFGISVALSGGRALVGAIDDACGADVTTGCGSSYVFDFDGTTWTETKLTASDAADGDRFGASVSLSGDRALVGASSDECAAGILCGAAYVFDLSRPLVDLAVASFTDPIARSGPFKVFATAENTTGEAITVRATLVVDLPGGSSFTAVGRTVTVPANTLIGPARALGTTAVPESAPSGTYTGTLVLTVDGTGEELDRETFTFELPGSSAVVASGGGVEDWTAIPEAASLVAPEALALLAPSPNPARGSVTLGYAVPQAGGVSVVVYNALGREMAVAASGEHAAGRFEARLDTSGLPAGVYVVRLTSGAEALVQRFTVVR